MNTIIRQYDGRDHALMTAYLEDRVDALKRALDICSREVERQAHQIALHEDTIDALRKVIAATGESE